MYKYPDIAEKPMSIADQIKKMIEELGEVVEAYGTGDRDQIGFETCNLEHTCETILRMLSSDPSKIQEWRRHTTKQNAARGYYNSVTNKIILDGATETEVELWK